MRAWNVREINREVRERHGAVVRHRDADAVGGGSGDRERSGIGEEYGLVFVPVPAGPGGASSVYAVNQQARRNEGDGLAVRASDADDPVFRAGRGERRKGMRAVGEPQPGVAVRIGRRAGRRIVRVESAPGDRRAGRERARHFHKPDALVGTGGTEDDPFAQRPGTMMGMDVVLGGVDADNTVDESAENWPRGCREKLQRGIAPYNGLSFADSQDRWESARRCGKGRGTRDIEDDAGSCCGKDKRCGQICPVRRVEDEIVRIHGARDANAQHNLASRVLALYGVSLAGAGIENGKLAGRSVVVPASARSILAGRDSRHVAVHRHSNGVID